MNQNIIELEKVECANILKKTFSLMSTNGFSRKFKNIYFVSDDNFICDYLLNAVVCNNNELNVFSKIAYIKSGFESDYRNNTIKELNVVQMDEVVNSKGKDVILFFVDCTDVDNKDKTLKLLSDVFKAINNKKKVRCVVSVMLPKIENFPCKVKALSEREYSFFIEKVCQRTPETDYYIEIEKMCRHAVKNNGCELSILRFDNVFAPDRAHTPRFDIKTQVEKCIANQHVDITLNDASHVATITYIRAACHAIFASLFRITYGHVYNVACEEATMEKIKSSIYTYDPKTFSASLDLPKDINYTYSSLSSLKFIKTGVRLQKQLTIGLSQLLDYLTTESVEEV